jgi:Na+-transporting methylmalonyl-CoA/oxaloacetate decarboxylase gamma subunit
VLDIFIKQANALFILGVGFVFQPSYLSLILLTLQTDGHSSFIPRKIGDAHCRQLAKKNPPECK